MHVGKHTQKVVVFFFPSNVVLQYWFCFFFSQGKVQMYEKNSNSLSKRFALSTKNYWKMCFAVTMLQKQKRQVKYQEEEKKNKIHSEIVQ